MWVYVPQPRFGFTQDRITQISNSGVQLYNTPMSKLTPFVPHSVSVIVVAHLEASLTHDSVGSWASPKPCQELPKKLSSSQQWRLCLLLCIRRPLLSGDHGDNGMAHLRGPAASWTIPGDCRRRTGGLNHCMTMDTGR